MRARRIIKRVVVYPEIAFALAFALVCVVFATTSLLWDLLEMIHDVVSLW